MGNKNAAAYVNTNVHGQWLGSLEDRGTGFTFVGNGDGTFKAQVKDAPGLCLTHKASGGSHTGGYDLTTVDAEYPWSWGGGGLHLLHATVNNCDGSNDQNFFAQKTGDRNSHLLDDRQEFAFLIRSVAKPTDCLNVEGASGGPGGNPGGTLLFVDPDTGNVVLYVNNTT